MRRALPSPRAPRAGRGIVFAAILGIAVALLVVSPDGPVAPAQAGGKACASESRPVAKLSLKRARTTLACVVGAERSERGLEPGLAEARLNEAARRHAERMIRTDCFEHRCRREPALEERIRRAGYLDGAGDWSFAENIGCAGTVGAVVRAWLRERSSRRNLLGAEFRDLGIGVTRATPSGCEGAPRAGTFTLVLGVRDP